MSGKNRHADMGATGAEKHPPKPEPKLSALEQYESLMEAQGPLMVSLASQYAEELEKLHALRDEEARLEGVCHTIAEAVVALGGRDPRDFDPVGDEDEEEE